MQFFRRVGLHEYGGHSPAGGDAAAAFCRALPSACFRYLYLLCGENPHGNVAPALLPTIMRFLPSGTSVHNMQHWSQVRVYV